MGKMLFDGNYFVLENGKLRLKTKKLRKSRRQKSESKKEGQTEIADGIHTTPLSVTFTNTTTGADFYEWTFEGGRPEHSSEKNPGTVLFTTPGEHRVSLRAWNLNGESTKEGVVREQKQAPTGAPLHESFQKTMLRDTADTALSFGEMLARYRGSVVYIDVWSLSCAPCIAEMPPFQGAEGAAG